MRNYLKQLFSPETENQDDNSSSFVSPGKKLQIATAALLLEIAYADEEFTEVEKNKIYSIMKESFQLNEDTIEKLLKIGEERVKDSVSIYEFTEILNNNFSKDELYEILKKFWSLIYVDEKLNQYEDSLIKKISGYFHLSHKEMIAAKLEAKDELSKN